MFRSVDNEVIHTLSTLYEHFLSSYPQYSDCVQILNMLCYFHHNKAQIFYQIMQSVYKRFQNASDFQGNSAREFKM